MFGVPAQTVYSWRRSLAHAIDLGVEHISTYGLTIEAGTPYARRYARDPAAFADDDLSAELYALAMDALTAAGYEHYEISNFARPGFRCAHNENYWANGEYLGLASGPPRSWEGCGAPIPARSKPTWRPRPRAERSRPNRSGWSAPRAWARPRCSRCGPTKG